jgi:hypothetical protein
LSIKVHLLKHLTKEWAGEPIDDAGLVRILNRTGKRPPLIWCFNGQREFPMLAAGLGPDQPVIGLRSLHMVERVGPTRYRNDQIAAELYLNALLSCVDLDECFVGGNCQGAGIAIHIASSLLKAGKNVRALIIMEAQPILPFPGRVGLIFGDRSEMFNPFLRGESPQARWKTLFSDPVLEIVPGTHGEYFRDENFPALCEAIARIIDFREGDRGAAKAPVEVSLDLIEPPSSLKARTKSPIQIRYTSRVAADLQEIGPVVVSFLWISAEHGPSDQSETHPLPIRPGGAVDTLTALVEAPAKAGNWGLHAFPCRENAGPVSWATNYATKCFVQVE